MCICLIQGLSSAKHFYVSHFPRARTYARTSANFTPNFKTVYSYTEPGFLYVTNTQYLCTHHFLRCRTASFVQSMFVFMDV